VRSGLVTREVDSGDRRVVRVRATRKGRVLLQRGRRRRIAHLARRLRGLSQRELALLERAAGLIERAVRDGGEAKRRN
ncbi:MAG: MarR family winged helix-turn-helix transcriptional regulator, partial [Candidatus Acidiferrales bacterium]